MPDYGNILRFLAENPPERPTERCVHASLLELLALSLREPARSTPEGARRLADASSTHLLATHLAKAMAHS